MPVGIKPTYTHTEQEIVVWRSSTVRFRKTEFHLIAV